MEPGAADRPPWPGNGTSPSRRTQRGKERSMSENKRPHLDEEAVLLLNKGRRGLLRLMYWASGAFLLLAAWGRMAVSLL